MATTVFSGQQYITATLVLPVILSIRQRLNTENKDLPLALNSFREDLASALTLKFDLANLTASSPRVVAASLDPRFRSLEFAGHLNIEADGIKLSIKRLAFELYVSSNESGGIETSDGLDYADDDAESDSSTSNDDDSDKKQADVIVTQTKPSLDSPPIALPLSGLDILLGRSVARDTSLSSSDIEAEVVTFFSERPVDNDVNSLEWWSSNGTHYTALAQLGMKVLCIPVTSVPSEQVFSACGVLVNKLPCPLSTEMVDAMNFLSKNRFLSAAGGAHASVVNVPSAAAAASQAVALHDEEEEPPLPCLEME